MALLIDPDTSAVHTLCVECGEQGRIDDPTVRLLLARLLDSGLLHCAGCDRMGTTQQVLQVDVEAALAEIRRII